MPHVELPQAEFKVVMLGETFTGKTSLVLRFAEGYYRDTSRNPTVGAFFITKRLTVQGMTTKIQIWDTAGQEQFKRLAPMYYKNAAAAIICYDVTSPKSFETLEYWMNELQQNVPAGGIVIAMCATKCDLTMNPDTSQAEALAATTGAMFMTTSSKTNSNVHLLFQRVTERVLDYQRRNAGLEIPVTLATTAVETSHNRNTLSNGGPPTTDSRTSIHNGTNGSNSLLCTNPVPLCTNPVPIDGEVSVNHLIDEKKVEQDDNVVVLDSEIVLSDDSKKEQVNMSRCDANMLMCGDVVGMTSDDGSINGCIMQ